MEYKRVYRSYRYNECDDFAAYLEDMASKGWIFHGWPNRLEFRKEEPQQIHYVVDVFPKGSENDTRPSPNAEEFADYCEAAGWEFIDGRRKFCIFQQICEDAVPIVTEEERFANIAKAQGRVALWNMIAFLLLSVVWIGEGLTVGFPQWFFMNIYLFIMVFWGVEAVAGIVQFISFQIWKHRTQKQIDNGENVYYGDPKKRHFIGREIIAIAMIAVLLVMMALTPGMAAYLPAVIAGVVLMLLLFWLIAFLRPSRGENVAFTIVGPIVIMLFLMVFVFITDNSQDASRNAENAPLQPSDYMDETVDLTYADYGKTSSIFGSMEQASFDYENGDDEASTNYQIYDSNWPGLLYAAQKRLSKKTIDETEISGKQRSQVKAVIQNGTRECMIRWPSRLVVIRPSSQLTADQIERIVRVLTPGKE